MLRDADQMGALFGRMHDKKRNKIYYFFANCFMQKVNFIHGLNALARRLQHLTG